MRLTGKKILTKLKQKNLGNVKLRKAVDQLVSDLEKHNFASFEELKKFVKMRTRYITTDSAFLILTCIAP
jgi:predicted nucleic acid-binding OB-fold protein